MSRSGLEFTHPRSVILDLAGLPPNAGFPRVRPRATAVSPTTALLTGVGGGCANFSGSSEQEVSMTELTDAEVIARSIDDPEAFGVVFDRYVDAVHGYLARRGGRESGDSLAGDVFRVAFEVRGRYRAEFPSALPWLYGIAANVLRQDARRQRRHARLADRLAIVRPVNSTLVPDPEVVVAREEAVAEALRAVALLPELDRESLLLFTWEQMSYEEIALALDIPLGTVRSRLHRARQRVREQLARAGHVRGEERQQPDRRCS